MGSLEKITHNNQLQKILCYYPFHGYGCVQEVLLQPTHGRTGQQTLQPQVFPVFHVNIFALYDQSVYSSRIFSENSYLKFWKLYRSQIHEHTILLRFPGIILIVLKLEVLYVFLKTYRMGYGFLSGFPPFFLYSVK